jgi:hypothetical protein
MIPRPTATFPGTPRSTETASRAGEPRQAAAADPSVRTEPGPAWFVAHPWVRAVYCSLVVHLALGILLGLAFSKMTPSPPPALLLRFAIDAAPLPGAERDPFLADVHLLDRQEAMPAAEAAAPDLEPAPVLDVPLPDALKTAPAAVATTTPRPPAAALMASLPVPSPPAAGGPPVPRGGDRGSHGPAAQFGTRRGEARTGSLESRGGSAASEEAVALGLEWLARHQQQNGSWSFEQHACPRAFDGVCRCRGKGWIEGHSKASTAFALLPFLGAGNTHQEGPYKDLVYRGIDFLKETLRIELRELHPDDPDFRASFSGDLYGYGITTLVLAEALGLVRAQGSDDPELARCVEALVAFLADHQHALGGWRYERGQPGDITVTGWQIVALKSSQMAGVKVDSQIFEKVGPFLDTLAPPKKGAGKDRDLSRYHYLASMASSPPRPANDCTSAIGLLSRMYTGWDATHPDLRRGIETILKNRQPPFLTIYQNFYFSQLLIQSKHPAWDRWNRQNRTYLISCQVRPGQVQAGFATDCEVGSWYFVDPASPMRSDRHLAPAGRLGHTCLAILTLEVYYRLLPIYQAEAVGGD